MKVLVLVLIVITLVVSTFAQNDKARQAALAKRKWLTSKAQTSEDSVISLDSQQFQRYGLSGGRTYGLVVFFTASEEKFDCQPCRELRKIIGALSQSFEGQRSDSGKQLYFVELDFRKQTEQVFHTLQIQQVPQVWFIDGAQKGLKLEGLFDILGQDNRFTFNQQFSPMALAQWIADKSGLDMPQGGGGGGGDYYEGGNGGNPIGGGPVSGAGFVVALLIVGLPIMYVQRRNPVVYFAIATLAFFFCISGGMFNIIRQVPFAEYDGRSGKTTYFSGGGQFQFGAEGYIMGFLQVLGGVLMVFLNTVAVKNKSFLYRNVSTMVLAIGLYFLFSKIRELYQIKMPGYNHGHVWNWRFF